MIPYRDEKIINSVYFFASQHREKTKQYLYQTFLYKYLAFFDFRSLEDTGEPALGLTYLALEKGPVPDEIYNSNKYRKTELYKFQKKAETVIIIPLQNAKPDYDYFSPFEIELLNNLIEIFAVTYINTKTMSDASHKEIMAWRRTWKNKPNSPIKYIDNFPGNLLKKSTENINPIEEHFLIFSGINKLA